MNSIKMRSFSYPTRLLFIALTASVRLAFAQIYRVQTVPHP
jgi:hypothetical protein